MKYLLMIVNGEADWDKLSQAEQLLVIDGMNEVDAQMKSAGQFVSCGGLAPSSMAKTVRLIDGGRKVEDGPAIQLKENKHLVTGFFVVETPSIEDAVGWAKKLPIVAGAIEIRPIAKE